MSLLTVFVPGMAEVAWHNFNAIATYITQNDFKAIMGIVLTFSVLAAMIQWVMTKDLMVFGRFLFFYVIITSIAFVPTPISIYNESNPGQVKYNQVDNVPLGVAFPASFFSSIFYAITVGFETIFHMPDDLNYTNTGMLFGNELMLATMNDSGLTEKDRQIFTKYVTNCVLPDRNLGLQSWEEIANAPDIWAVLDKHQSPIRGFNYRGSFQTCAQIYKPMKQELLGIGLDKTMRRLANKLFGESQDPAREIARLKAALPQAYAYFTKQAGRSAADIIMQNTLINSFRQAPSDYAAFSNSPAAVMNYSFATQQQRLAMANNNSAHMATHTLPMTQFFFFMFLCAISVFVLLLMFIPSMTIPLFKTYMGSFLWVQSWPIGFALVNFFMTIATHYATGEANGGIILSNQASVAKTLSDFSGVAGYMALSVPILMYGVVKGMATVTSQAAQYFGGLQHSISQGVAAEAQSGNFTMGNTSINNTSFDNMNAHKNDTNFTSMAGSSTMQTASGSTVTEYAGGNWSANTPISQTSFGLNGAHMVSQSLQQQASEMHQRAISERQQGQQQLSTGFDSLKGLDDQTINQMAMNNNWTSDQKGQFTQDVRTAQKYLESHSVDQASLAIQASAGSTQASGKVTGYMKAEGGISIPVLGGVKTGVSGEMSLGHTGSSTTTDQTQTNTSHGNVSQADQDFSSAYNRLQAYDTSQSASSLESHSGSSLSSIRSNISEGLSHLHQASIDESQSQSFGESAQYIDNHSNTVSQNLMPEFQGWLTSEAGLSERQAQALVANSGTSAGVDRISPYIDSFSRQYSQQLSQQYTQEQSGMNASGERMVSNGQAQVNNLAGEDKVRSTYKGHSDNVSQVGKNIHFNEEAYTKHTGQVQRNTSNIEQTIYSKEDALNKKVEQHRQVEKQQYDKQKDNSDRMAVNPFRKK